MPLPISAVPPPPGLPLQKHIDFYTKQLGMQLLRQRDIPEDKYSNAFLGYGPETTNFAGACLCVGRGSTWVPACMGVCMGSGGVGRGGHGFYGVYGERGGVSKEGGGRWEYDFGCVKGGGGTAGVGM